MIKYGGLERMDWKYRSVMGSKEAGEKGLFNVTQAEKYKLVDEFLE